MKIRIVLSHATCNKKSNNTEVIIKKNRLTQKVEQKNVDK